MILLLFLLFPSLLFASSNRFQMEGTNSGFISPEQFVSRELLSQELSIPENLTLPKWMLEPLEADLEQFGPYNPKDLNGPLTSTCTHFRIRNGQLEVKVHPSYLIKHQRPKVETLCIAIYRLLHSKGRMLKDGDFLILLKDGAEESSPPYPILCFAKPRDSKYILIPDWFSLSSEAQSNNKKLLQSIFQQKGDVIHEVMAGEQKYPWHQKENKAFWRGGAHGDGLDSNKLWKKNPRAVLVLFSIEHPDLVHARFLNTRFYGVCTDMSKQKSKISAPWMSPLESCQYKYQVDVDGWASGYHRCQWVLRSNCVPIKQESPWIQWYYAGLEPFVHYVPYQSDCKDLTDKINWLRENDDLAYDIATAGQQFANLYLSEEMTHLYLYEVLKRVLEKCNPGPTHK